MGLGSQGKNRIMIEQINFSEYSQQFEIYFSRFDKPTIFNSPSFLRNYFQNEKDYLILKYIGDDLNFAFAVFTKDFDGSKQKIIYESHKFAPYASITSTSSDVSFLKRLYSTLLNYLKNIEPENNYEVRFREPPSAYFPTVSSREWILWSENGLQTSAYFGRYFKSKADIKLNRNRVRNLLKINSSKIEIRQVDQIENDFYEIIKKNRMDRHNVKLTHSILDLHKIEINMKNFVSYLVLYHNDHACVVMVLFEDYCEIILQYLAGTDCSYENNLQDYLMNYYLLNIYSGEKSFVLGTSTDPNNSHRTLNIGLDKYKQSWGAKPYICYRYTFTNQI